MESFDLEPGNTVSHFRLESLLGEGGMGAVYLAEDLTLSRQVAIKFMRRSLLAQQASADVRESLEKRFIREAKSAAAINHPNLAQIYEANFDSDNWFIAMEFINGKPLDEYLSEGKLYSVVDLVQITRQTVGGLKFAWENYKIIHRDIKPQNIMLTKDNLVKIVDLGLAKPMASAEPDYEMPELTCAGTPLGTPQYMAPEQATGQADVDFKVDIFALGATIYEIATGKKAFSGNTAPMIYMAQIQKKYDPIRELREEVPQELADLLDAMMEPKPEDRIGSYDEIMQALNAVPLDQDASKSGVFQSYYEPSPTMATLIATRAGGVGETPSMFYPSDMLIRDRYRILKPIGKGRAGMVYHCLDTQLGVECAVKSLFPGREFPEQEMPRIKTNFQRLLGLSHPNLVQIRDLQEDDQTGELFIVTEMMIGQNFREYVHKLTTEHATVTVEMVEPVLAIIAKALDSISSTFKVIHHDLKPESIFLIDGNTNVKLLDYSITYPLDDEPLDLPADELHKYPIATPDYMSPELWRREGGSTAADLYSFAAIIYEVLSRRLPFWLLDQVEGEPDPKEMTKEEQLERLFTRVTAEQPKELPELKRNENAALMRALEKDPAKRHASCEDFVRSLCGTSKFAAGGAGKWIAIAAGLVLVCAVAFAMTRPTSTSPGGGTVGLPPPTTTGGSTATSGNPGGTSTAAAELAALEARQLKERLEKERLEKERLEREREQREREAAEAKRHLDDIKRRQELEALRRTADQTRQAYARVRMELDDKEGIEDGLKEVDKLAKLAGDAYEKQDYSATVNHYKEATISLTKLQDLVRQRERARIEQLQAEAEQLKDQYAKERLELAKDALAVPLLPKASEAGDRAKVLMIQADYEPAIASYKDALKALEGIRVEAAKLAKQQLVAQKAKAEAVKRQFVDLRIALGKRKGAEPLLAGADEISKAALGLLTGEDYVAAIRKYQEAIEACHDVESELKKGLRKEALELQTQIAEKRRGITDFEALSTDIAERVIKCDVNLALARESINKEEFQFAIDQLQKAAVIIDQISKTASERYQASKGRDFTVPKVGMEFVWVSQLNMWVGKYEVTNGEYRIFKPKHDSKKEEGFSLNQDRQPVLHVSYYNVLAFCQWMNAVPAKSSNIPDGYQFRLPTMAEWKQLARCGTDRRFPWGDDWPPKYGNFGNQEVFPAKWRLDGYTDDKFPVTCVVEESGVNEWGLHGISGNVWEWTTTKRGNTRAVLGGAWNVVSERPLEVDVEAFAPGDDAYDNIGFRVLLAPPATE